MLPILHSNFADGEEYVSGYVAVTGGVATENYVEAGKEATLNGVTSGSSIGSPLVARSMLRTKRPRALP